MSTEEPEEPTCKEIFKTSIHDDGKHCSELKANYAEHHTCPLRVSDNCGGIISRSGSMATATKRRNNF
jgi:hypothetical protein